MTRQRGPLKYEVKERREVSGNVISDEVIVLTGDETQEKYMKPLRRIFAAVELNGQKHDMVFLTNNLDWAAETICELYRARWNIEVFFKELKQTLQFADFIGYNENAVKWQVWIGLLVHMLLHYAKFLSAWTRSFARLVGIVRGGKSETRPRKIRGLVRLSCRYGMTVTTSIFLKQTTTKQQRKRQANENEKIVPSAQCLVLSAKKMLTIALCAVGPAAFAAEP